ncbi:MAG TPA: SxtJ family membrane protein [Pirellulales bacterium]|jgi:hypothetical protein
MALIDIAWKPSDRQLRQFGAIALVALPLAGWLFSGKPWPAAVTHAQGTAIVTLAALGVIAAVLAVVRPQTLRWPFVGATLVTLPIGLVVGEIVLAVIYFGMFLPVSLIFRLMGRDALERRVDRNVSSYWQPKTQPAGPESYFRQS